jgi:hypothetical protein
MSSSLTPEAELAQLNDELALDLAQAAVDAAGIVDPTPISDGVGAAMSIYRGDPVGAGLSIVSMVPYIGDAIGKTAKGARLAAKIAKTRKRIAALVAQIRAGKSGTRAANRAAGTAAATKPLKGSTGAAADCPPSSPSTNRDPTGFSGRKGSELKNAPYQKVRNSPAQIGDRTYSGHALDQMQNRGIPPSVVENTIQHGKPFPGNRPGTQGYSDPVNKVKVIVNTDNGTVVTVIPGGGK